MSTEVEVGRLVVRLIGDNKDYLKSIEMAQKQTQAYATSAEATFSRAAKVMSVAGGLAAAVAVAAGAAFVGVLAKGIRDASQESESFQKELEELRYSTHRLSVGLGERFVPALETGVGLLKESVVWLDQNIRSSSLFQETIGKLAEEFGILQTALAFRNNANIGGVWNSLLNRNKPSTDVEKFIQLMEQDRDLFGLTGHQRAIGQFLLKLEARGDKLRTIDERRIAALDRQLTRLQQMQQLEEQRQQVATDIAEFTTALQRDVDFFGLTGHQRAVADFLTEVEESGHRLTTQERGRILALDQQLTRLEHMKKLEEERKQAAREAQQKYESWSRDQARLARQLLEDQLTPIEQLRQSIDEVYRLAQIGALTQAQAQAIAQSQVSAYAASLGDATAVKSAGGGVFAGSSEAMIAMRAGEGPSQKAIEEGIWDLVERADVSIDTEQQLLAAMEAFANRFTQVNF